MKIFSAKLVTHHEFPDENGELIPVVVPHFQVKSDESEDVLRVPFDPQNRHYVELREWYDKQKKKPFKFDFER